MDNRIRATIALVLLTAAGTHAILSELGDVIDVIKVGLDLKNDIFHTWESVNAGLPSLGSSVDIPFLKAKEREVLSRIEEVHRVVNKLELKLEQNGVVLSSLSLQLSRDSRLELKLNEVSDLLSRVENADRLMREYVSRQEDLESVTLENFAAWVVAHGPTSLVGLIERIHALVVPGHGHALGKGLLLLMLANIKVCIYNKLCIKAAMLGFTKVHKLI